ncbi:hypothetical protein V9T40_004352 [Parthenolecanium corni]|uniref:Uncharacterized protein n=1 Tax=Parthenolecanium corni TaxID=536013 RepID=A0AAN9U1U6_9HEMI
MVAKNVHTPMTPLITDYNAEDDEDEMIGFASKDFVIFLFFFQYFLACPCTAVPYSPYVLSLRFPDPSFSLSSSFCREVRRFIACVLPANRLAGKGEQDERNEREARTLFSNPLLSLIRQSFSFSLYSPQKLSSFSFPPLFRRGLLLSLLLSFQDLIESILRDVFGIPFLASSVFVEKCVSAEKKTVSVCLRAPIPSQPGGAMYKKDKPMMSVAAIIQSTPVGQSWTRGMCGLWI